MARVHLLRTVMQLNRATKAILLFVVVLFILVPLNRGQRSTLDAEALDKLWSLPREEVAARFEGQRQAILKRRGYSPSSAAHKLFAPKSLPDGSPNLDPSVDAYTQRLSRFVAQSIRSSSARKSMEESIARLNRMAPPRARPLPQGLFSADPRGDSGVNDLFRLWKALLPLPLSPELSVLLPETEWAAPARQGGKWKGIVADDGQVDAQVSNWLDESVFGVKGAWVQTWEQLSGVMHADLFRIMSMLFEGGIYADADTAPIAHPYLWGLEAEKLVHPDLETIEQVLLYHEKGIDTTHRRVWQRDAEIEQDLQLWNNVTFAWNGPVYPRKHRRRGPLFRELIPPNQATTILSPDVNLVVAIEWDSSMAWSLKNCLRWSFGRLYRSLRRTRGRSLQLSQSVIAAKPFHPVLIDALATAKALVDKEAKRERPTLAPVDATGAGVMTDALMRYLIVRYGVTPDQLRGLRSPVKVGDVLILPEGAFMAPPAAMQQFLSYVRRFFPSLPGSGVAQVVPDTNLWYWGTGYSSWQTGGNRVVYQGRPLRKQPALDVNEK